MQKVLITGGAGFIGSHLADELLAHGYQVRVLDSLEPQVHGEARKRPDYLAPEVELVVGDVNDRQKVDEALRGVDAVYHFAAAVGVGQSMYEVAGYTYQWFGQQDESEDAGEQALMIGEPDGGLHAGDAASDPASDEEAGHAPIHES